MIGRLNLNGISLIRTTISTQTQGTETTGYSGYSTYSTPMYYTTGYTGVSTYNSGITVTSGYSGKTSSSSRRTTASGSRSTRYSTTDYSKFYSDFTATKTGTVRSKVTSSTKTTGWFSGTIGVCNSCTRTAYVTDNASESSGSGTKTYTENHQAGSYDAYIGKEEFTGTNIITKNSWSLRYTTTERTNYLRAEITKTWKATSYYYTYTVLKHCSKTGSTGVVTSKSTSSSSYSYKTTGEGYRSSYYTTTDYSQFYSDFTPRSYRYTNS